MMIEWKGFYIFHAKKDYIERRHPFTYDWNGEERNKIGVTGCGHFNSEIEEPRRFPCVVTRKYANGQELIVLRGDLIEEFDQYLQEAKSAVENDMKFLRSIERISGRRKIS